MGKKLLLCLYLLGSVLTLSAQDFNATEYDKALWMSTRFFGGQRMTDNNNPIQNNWLIQDYLPTGVPAALEGLSYQNDKDGTYDLSGGWFDCGDHVFFGQTGFFAAYALLKGYDAFPSGFNDYYSADYNGYRTSGDYSWAGAKGEPNCIPDVLDEVKHATDFFIKCAKSPTEFYFEKGDGDWDHVQRVTSVKMQTNSTNTGGSPRPMWKNPADANMASMCGATLALMSKVYREIDPDYADVCLTHAEYAYAYAKANPGAIGAVSGNFYPPNDNWKNGYAILLSEMYRATNNTTYRTEAYALSTGNGSTGDVRPNAGYTFDYSNTGELALYCLAEIGHPTALGHFNARITGHFLNNSNYNGQAVYSAGGTWGKMRYPGNAAYIVALHSKINNTPLHQRVFDNIDYIMGSNTGNQSYIVGYTPPVAGGKTPTQAHHRNAYLYEGNSNTYNGPLPAKNREFGALVGGALNGTYNDVWNDYVNTEVCVDYNAPFTAALGAIKSQLSAVDLSVCGNVKPSLGEDMSICGATAGLVLNANIPVDNRKTFQWFRNDVQIFAPSTARNTITVTQAGTYRVVLDSAGLWNTKDEIVIAASLPAIALGDDIELCAQATDTLIGFVAGQGINYSWTKDGAPISTTPNLIVYTAGTYQLVVTAAGCPSVSDAVVVTSLLPTVENDTICAAGIGTLKATSAGDFSWYADAEGTDLVHTGSTYSVSVPTTTTFYVKDNSSFSGQVGPTAISGSYNAWGKNGHDQGYYIVFTPTTSFSITSMKMSFSEIYSTNSGVLQVEVRNSTGTLLGTYTSDQRNFTTTNTPGLYEFTFATNPIEIDAAWGSNLRMSINTNGTTVQGQTGWYQGITGTNTYQSNPSGVVTINGVVANGQTANNHYAYLYDWKIAAGTTCAPAPATIVVDPLFENCAITTACLNKVYVAATAASTVAPETCEQGEWTHYYKTNTPNNIVFSIQKNGNNIAFTPTITVNPLIAVTDGSTEGHFVMGRRWDVQMPTGAVIDEPVSVRFYYTQAEYNAMVNAATTFATTNGLLKSDVRAFKTNSRVNFLPSFVLPDVINNSYELTDFTFGETANGVKFVQINNITSFSGGSLFIQVGTQQILPITFKSININDNDLSWSAEGDVETFNVLASKDGITFENVATISANANGNYTFDVTGINATYYRIEGTDESGDNFTSSVVKNNNNISYPIAIYPNPTSDYFSIDNLPDNCTITVFDVMGSKVLQTTTTNSFEFGSEIPSGIYRLQITGSNNEIIQVNTIVKL